DEAVRREVLRPADLVVRARRPPVARDDERIRPRAVGHDELAAARPRGPRRDVARRRRQRSWLRVVDGGARRRRRERDRRSERDGASLHPRPPEATLTEW